MVAEIEVRGNKKVELDAVLTILKSAKGKDFSTENVKDDIRRLYELNFFDRVKSI